MERAGASRLRSPAAMRKQAISLACGYLAPTSSEPCMNTSAASRLAAFGGRPRETMEGSAATPPDPSGRPWAVGAAIAGRILASAALAACWAAPAAAQTYPAKPIRIIVAFAPGGPADVMARLVGQRLTTLLGQTIVVENRPGAGGTIGARAAAEAEADGYTLLLGNTSTLVIGPAVYRQAGYDPIKSFAPIAMLGTTSNFLIVNSAVPARSV